MAILSEPLIEILKTAVPSTITGFVAITAVFVTQSQLRKHERSKQRVEQKRKHLQERANALASIASNIIEAQFVSSLHVGNALLIKDHSAKLPELRRPADLVTNDWQDELFAAYLRGIDDRLAQGKDLFQRLSTVCSEAIAAAELVGPLPEDLSIDGSTDLVAILVRLQMAHFRESSKPGEDERVQKVIDDIRARVIPTCRTYRQRLLQELEAL